MIKEINDHFDAVYVLTIKEATERHKHIMNEFSGVKFTFMHGVNKNDIDMCHFFPGGEVPAVHLRKVDPEERHKERLIDPQSKHGPGMAACALGHRLIYEDVVSKNYQRVLIFEDDAVLIKERKEDFIASLSNLPKKWDMIYFGYSGGIIDNPQLPLWQRKILYFIKSISGHYNKFNSRISKPYNKYFDIASEHAGAFAYAITNKTAKDFISIQTPLTFSADSVFNYYHIEKASNSFIISKNAFVDATYFDAEVYLPSLLNYRE